MYKVYDMVRIKELSEIEKTLNIRGQHKDSAIYFVNAMHEYCGKAFQVTSYFNGRVTLRTCLTKKGLRWSWDLSWIEPMRPDNRQITG